MDKMDCKILAKVYGALLETGAASAERLLQLTELESMRSIHWAVYQLHCVEGGGLYSLPDHMLPKDWAWDPSTMPAVTAVR